MPKISPPSLSQHLALRNIFRIIQTYNFGLKKNKKFGWSLLSNLHDYLFLFFLIPFFCWNTAFLLSFAFRVVLIFEYLFSCVLTHTSQFFRGGSDELVHGLTEAGNIFQHFSNSYSLKDECYHCLKSDAIITVSFKCPIIGK